MGESEKKTSLQNHKIIIRNDDLYEEMTKVYDRMKEDPYLGCK